MQLSEVALREFVSTGGFIPSSNVFLGERIDGKVLSVHAKQYPSTVSGKPLVALNRKSPLGFPFTGFLITDQSFAFKTVRDSMLSSLLPRKGGIAVMPLSEVRSWQIGRHDRCLGTAYVGHQLMINGEVVGLVRMGAGIVFDDKAIAELHALATFLFGRGELDAKPELFAWQ